MSKVQGISWVSVFTLVFLVTFTKGEVFGDKWHEHKFFHRMMELDAKSFKELANIGSRVNFETVLKPLLIPRVSGTENNTLVRKFLMKHMERIGWEVETDAFEQETPYGKKPFENIIATLNPDIHRRLVLACHYDSKYFEEFEFIGAIDSAVPCAMLIHLASVLHLELREHKHSKQSVSLQFIFFDGEEAFKNWSSNDSLYGSRHLAQKWEETPYPPGNQDNTTMLDRMDVLMLLDLLGTKDIKIRKLFDSTSHWFNALIQTETKLRISNLWTGSSATLPMFKTKFRARGVEDDHVPFLHRDVDCLHIISLPFPTIWHTEKDNKDALDFDTIDNLNKIFRIFVARYLHLPSFDNARKFKNKDEL